MKITSLRLKEIVEKELRRFSEADDAGLADQGGDQTSAPAVKKEKDVEKVEKRMDQYLSALLSKISSEKEFAQLMSSFVKKASEHPSVKANAVRRTLIALTKQVMQDAKAKKG